MFAFIYRLIILPLYDGNFHELDSVDWYKILDFHFIVIPIES